MNFTSCMCLAVPCRVVSLKKGRAVVASDDHTHDVDAHLLRRLRAGDYVLVHGDMAIHKVPKGEAKAIIAMMDRQRVH